MTDTAKQTTQWLIGVIAFLLQAGGIVYYTGVANAQLSADVRALTMQVSDLKLQVQEMRHIAVDVAVLKARKEPPSEPDNTRHRYQ